MDFDSLAMESCLAPDSMTEEPLAASLDSEMTPASMAPKQSLASDSIAVELASDCVADDSLMLKLVAHDSMAVELAPDSVADDNITAKLVAHDSTSLEDVPESTTPKLAAPTSEFLEVVPDSEELPPGAFVCARCHCVHEDRQSWDRAHSRRWPCACCGLVHLEYMVMAMFYGFKEFDCKNFIPVLDNFKMNGNNVKFDKEVLKMLMEKHDLERAARKV
jgi:hypothetical protein